ncbi:hypothetical protein [Lactococcus ileimucosae]|uniref:hypothetical protein n=1 Tax=Lactococcus ileimucosae TaxID=2941329 RepID=UPI003516C54E
MSKLQKQYTEAVAAQKKAKEESSDVTTDPQSIQAQIDSENQAIEQSNQTIKLNELALEEAQTNLIQAQNSQTIIVKAKQEGIAFVGDINATTRPLVKILSKDTLIRAQVSEFEYDQIKQGTSIKVRTMDLKQTVEGTISSRSLVPVHSSTSEARDTANVTNATAYYAFIVKPKENLQYGYNVQVIVPDDDLLIPKTAVKNGMAQLEQNDGTFKSVRVETQPKNGQLLVTSGLKIGDKIVQNGESHD